ncbi:hypothetical protein B0H10DRAFT_1942861 [Mycena sp. CBHHK59/15]|nr:hypothetical protein B0H10DRAFT_1942861 [Mycena sp. CBHHK59/15]
MQALIFLWAFFSVFFVGLEGTTALKISQPLFLTPGPTRINFTKEASDTPGAFFNIVVPSNGTRLANNTDLSVGFVDVIIEVLPGSYEIVAYSNETGPSYLGGTDDFLVIPAIATATSSNARATPSGTHSRTSAAETASSPPAASASDAVAATSSKPPIGMIVGVVVGVLVLIFAVLLFLCFRHKMRQRKRMENYLHDPLGILEAPPASRPPVMSSLNNTSQFSRTQPPAQMNPFTTSSSLGSSASKAAQRQEYITNEMRIVRKQMEELNRHHRSSSSLPSSVASSQDTSVTDLERSRQQNEVLQGRITRLERELQSAWALGLSNEAPPGYVE